MQSMIRVSPENEGMNEIPSNMLEAKTLTNMVLCSLFILFSIYKTATKLEIRFCNKVAFI